MTPDAPRPPRPAAPRGGGGRAHTNGPGLLLAEPDLVLAGRAVARFEGAGVFVTVCHDGAEALIQAGARRPAAILLAAPLPAVGAAQVTELIARLHTAAAGAARGRCRGRLCIRRGRIR